MFFSHSLPFFFHQTLLFDHSQSFLSQFLLSFFYLSVVLLQDPLKLLSLLPLFLLQRQWDLFTWSNDGVVHQLLLHRSYSKIIVPLCQQSSVIHPKNHSFFNMEKIVGNTWNFEDLKELGWLADIKVTEDVYKLSFFIWIKWAPLSSQRMLFIDRFPRWKYDDLGCHLKVKKRELWFWINSLCMQKDVQINFNSPFLNAICWVSFC